MTATTTLTANEKEILELFDEGARLKEIARTSRHNIDEYLKAVKLFRRAAELSQKSAQEENEPNNKTEHQVFGHYYAYEEQYCLGGYYYEKHDTTTSTKHLKLAAEELTAGITLIENLPDELSVGTKTHLRTFLPNWKHFQRHLDLRILSNEARAAFDSRHYIRALDIYRKMAGLERDFINRTDFNEIAPQYQRNAIGNYLGSMMNISSALQGIILEKTRVEGEEGVSEIPFDLLIKLVKYTLDAYRFGSQAYDQNPEWDQYLEVTHQCFHNLERFLQENPSACAPLSIAFQDDQDFLKALRFAGVANEPPIKKTNKIKVLILSANPTDTLTLRLDEELRSIMQKVRAAEYRDRFEFAVAVAARPDDFLQAITEHRPHIVHFSGHGNPNEIVVCDDAGNAKPVGTDALLALFKSTQSEVKVVLLNACYSKLQAQAIVSVVPCAIGMNDAISDLAASIFASSFYRALAFGYSVKHAFSQGIAALKLEGLDDDYDIPELITGTEVDPAKVFLVDSQ